VDVARATIGYSRPERMAYCSSNRANRTPLESVAMEERP
jgi:hypothetical protein